jgi:hypothetical protein
MASNNRYGGVIWTNHALERLRQRNMPQSMALDAFHHPDSTSPGKKSHTTEFQKRMNNYFVTVIATKNDTKEWVILSCWVDPPMPGSIDIQKKKAYLEYRNGSIWKKIWITIRQQLGL